MARSDLLASPRARRPPRCADRGARRALRRPARRRRSRPARPGSTHGDDAGPSATSRTPSGASPRSSASHGVGAGDRVLVVCDNRIDVALHAFASARLGAVPVPVNHRLTAARDRTPSRRRPVPWRSSPTTRCVDRVPDRLAAADASPSVADRVGRRRSARGRPATWTPARPSILLTTSGTTGVPKAASLTSHGPAVDARPADRRPARRRPRAAAPRPRRASSPACR